MFRRSAPKPKTIWTRLGMFAFGVMAVWCGLALLKRDVFAYHNYFRAAVYSPGMVVLGGVLMLLAIVPDSIVEALVRRGKQTPRQRR